jgi:hypothetical protein
MEIRGKAPARGPAGAGASTLKTSPNDCKRGRRPYTVIGQKSIMEILANTMTQRRTLTFTPAAKSEASVYMNTRRGAGCTVPISHTFVRKEHCNED